MPIKSGETIFIENISMTRILLVSDDSVTLNSIFNHLSGFGYKVVTACDGIEGLSKFVENHFDIVITDIAMPKIDGITLVEKIRDNSNQKYVPAIAIAANPCLPEYSPFDAFFRKPLAIEKLLNTIEKAINNGKK